MSIPLRTIGDLMRRIGDVSLDRIRMQPPPGTATVADVEQIAAHEGMLCELIGGVLVEKVMGFTESRLEGFLLTLMMNFVHPRNLGIVTGADSTVELMPDLVRIPDVAFTSWDRMPGRRCPTAPIPRLVPNLAVEVLSMSNRPGEMAAKRRDYFAAGVELVWEVDPENRTVAVYTTATDRVVLGVSDVLDGGTVLLRFRLPLADLFAELDRHG